MKKLTFLLILFVIYTSHEVIGLNVKVKCTVTLEGPYQPDSIFIGLYFTHENHFEASGYPPSPEIFERVVQNTLEFEAEPGIYLIGCCAWRYAHAYRLIYLDPDEKNIHIHFTMRPLPLGYGRKMGEIEKVGIKGEFNEFNQATMAPLVKNNETWKLEEIPEGLTLGQMYILVVNDEETEDLMNNNIVTDRHYLNFKNIYSGNEIIFNPKLYGVQENHSSVEIQDPSQINKQLMSLSAALISYEKSREEIMSRQNESEEVNYHVLLNDFKSQLDKMETDYDAGFNQLFLEKRLELQKFKSFYMHSALSRKNSTREQYTDFFNSEEFSNYFAENLILLNKLDTNSYMLKGDFLQIVLIMDNISKNQPQILTKHNLHTEYFSHFIDSFIENSRSERLCCNLILDLATMQAFENEDKANELLDRLYQYDYKNYVSNNRLLGLRARLNIKIGKQAPDFDVTTVEGDLIKLKDYKGKFVFLDFWGSWCAPCIKELPHIKKLYSIVSRDKLEVIGLAKDEEELLKKCIADNEIEYPNALASRSLLLQFGIRQFPTSLLINPDGKIVRMNMRGEDELQLIAEEIDRYFK